ncbi:signal peptidase I [Rothia sp. LK2588]|uniref:signal peptidase I n=1 Tax=Rothia sp. LK2588 TaxID=3114369 RepID=UPI0034CDA404
MTDQTPSADDKPLDEASSDSSRKRGKRNQRASSRREIRESEKSGAWAQIKEFLLVIFYALLIAFLLKTFVLRGFYIPSGSMENTLAINDRVFVNVAGSTFGDAERGDIIVFKDTQGWIDSSAQRPNAIRQALSFVGVMPDSSNNYLVKRVIGKGGDHVSCCSPNGKLYVNGQEITEDYIYPGANPSDIKFDVVVPENSYFVMGDHRNNSADSRYHIERGTEFISEADVEGEVFVIAWPLNHFKWLNGAEETFANVPDTAPSK